MKAIAIKYRSKTLFILDFAQGSDYFYINCPIMRPCTERQNG